LSNAEIARMLHEFAELWDLKGDVFKRNAYRRAARGVEMLDGDAGLLSREGRLENIPGVGKNIALKIREFVETGSSRELETLRKELPPGMAELMKVPDIGPRTAMRLYRELGVGSLEELKEAARQHSIRSLPELRGNARRITSVRGIEMVERQEGRMLLGSALPIAEAVAAHIRAGGIPEVSVAGSLRRMRETVRGV